MENNVIEAGHIFGAIKKGSYVVVEPQIDRNKRKKLGSKKRFELAKLEFTFDSKGTLYTESQLRNKIKKMGLERERAVLVAWTKDA
jgi:hypothetical protein